jgi:hypothetical protein
MNISQYSTVDTPSGGDLIPLYDISNSDTRKLSLTALATYINGLNTSTSGLKSESTTQYSSPSATAFNTQVTDGSANIWLLLTPLAGYAAGTITLPAIANVVDKQEVTVVCTQDVTTLTVAGNGATGVVGEPSGITANDYFTLKYDELYDTWYRVK